ncbi:MAG: hypothetical protein KGK08_03290 [Acidobacteriota bacterium]|nr:hypothetical protein [Acidobacteriota bacterium]
MATITTLPVETPTATPAPPTRRRQSGVGLTALLALLAALLHGYHPYAEDGGLYLAGVRKLLQPELYPQQTAFVTEHLRFSVFARVVAGLVRISHGDVMVWMALLYVGSFWLLLFAGWQVAQHCLPTLQARLGAVALLAVCITLPIAGTSLLLMDQYVTARSFATPLGLLAVAAALEATTLNWPTTEVLVDARRRRRAALRCGLLLLAAAVLHPLMAAFAAALCALVAASGARKARARNVALTALALLALGGAALLQLATPAETATYTRVAMTRSYWFLARWAWYEQFGLVAPLLILAAAGWWPGSTDARRRLARATTLAGALASLVALTLARPQLAVHLVARLQPLRMFVLVYVVMILLLGGWLAEHWMRNRPSRWLLVFAALAAIFATTERATFPASSYWELPGAHTSNPWEQAFLWARSHTPTDALFALDAHYITAPGEDAQSFRAIAQRSMLPDFSKDGGEAAITPSLAEPWAQGVNAQSQLDQQDDAARIRTLRPLGVSWLLLQRDATTNLPCPYQNVQVKVCRLP